MSSLLQSLQKGSGDYIESVSSNGSTLIIKKGDGSSNEIKTSIGTITPEEPISSVHAVNTEYSYIIFAGTGYTGTINMSGIYDILLLGAGGGTDGAEDYSGGGGTLGVWTGVVLNEEVSYEIGAGSRGNSGGATKLITKNGTFTAPGGPESGAENSGGHASDNYNGKKFNFSKASALGGSGGYEYRKDGQTLIFNNRTVRAGGGGGIYSYGTDEKKRSAGNSGGGEAGFDGEDGTGGAGGSDFGNGTYTRGGNGRIRIVKRSDDYLTINSIMCRDISVSGGKEFLRRDGTYHKFRLERPYHIHALRTTVFHIIDPHDQSQNRNSSNSYHKDGMITIENVNGSDRVNALTVVNGPNRNKIIELRTNGKITCTDVIQTSDLRVKRNIENIDSQSCFEKVLRTQGKSFNFINSDHREIGYIAQEIEKDVPEIVSHSEEDSYSVSYGKMVVILSEAIKHLNTKYEMLSKDMDYLKKCFDQS